MRTGLFFVYHEFENFLKQTIPENREAVEDCFMTKGCQDTGGMLMNGKSGRLAECSDVGIGSDDEVRLSGAVVEVGCELNRRSCRRCRDLRRKGSL